MTFLAQHWVACMEAAMAPHLVSSKFSTTERGGMFYTTCPDWAAHGVVETNSTREAAMRVGARIAKNLADNAKQFKIDWC